MCSYDTLVEDTTRVMNRVKAIYRGRAIQCTGRDVSYQRSREQWLEKLGEAGGPAAVRVLYQELDALRQLRQQAACRVITVFWSFCEKVGFVD